MNFIKTSFLSGISTAISLLARLISTKIVAVYLGTNGKVTIDPNDVDSASFDACGIAQKKFRP